MRSLIAWLFGSRDKNNLESNLKEYETNREVHCNKTNKRRTKN